MSVKQKKESLHWVVLICSVLIAFVLWMIGSKKVEDYQMSYIHQEERMSIIETKATSLGTTYQEYTAQEGNELYQIDFLLQNDNIINQYYFPTYFDFPEVLLASNGYYGGSTMAEYFGDSMLRVIPAGMQGRFTFFLEVPKGIQSVMTYRYIDNEKIEMEISLTNK